MINTAAILDHHAAIRPGKVALAWRGGKHTFQGLLARVNTTAAALANHGIREGDHVALLMQNTPEFIEMIYALNRLGAVFAPINYRLAPAEWRYIIENSEAVGILTESHYESDVASVLHGLPVSLRLTVDKPATADFENYHSFIEPHRGRSVTPVDVAPTALQRIMYTSGTTSRPKGVCLTHANFMWKTLGLLIQFGWNTADLTIVAGPLYHVGALDMGGLTTLHAGGTLVLQRKFAAADLLTLIEEYRATNCWLAPAMVNLLLDCPELRSRDLSSLRTILSGGEKMPETRLHRVLEALPHVWFADAYGSTETLSSDTFLDRNHMFSKLGSVGLPLAHNQIRIVDDTGNTVAAGVTGEIVVRGPKVFSGYWRDPEATKAAIRNGWFHTGDAGHMDGDGYLYVEDRLKDMLVSGGENIASPEVERALYEHPAVLEAAVVGADDAQWGQVPKAFVVLREGTTVTADDLQAFCRDRLAKFKVPKYIEFTCALPRTPSGKVLKRNLRPASRSEGWLE